MLLRAATTLGLIGGITVGTYKYTTRLIPISEDEVIWAWLEAEVSDSNHQFALAYAEAIAAEENPVVLDCPNFENPIENAARRNVFNSVRGNYYLWAPIHDSTKWYRTRVVIPGPQLQFLRPIFPFIYGPYPPNYPPVHSPSDLEDIILWGNKKSGPFTVLEGNHRWYNRERKTLMPSVYIGLSKTPYGLHDQTIDRYN